MRAKTLFDLLKDIEPDTHILIDVLDTPMHLASVVSFERRTPNSEPYVVIGLEKKYTFSSEIEKSRY